jgi:hypothetical protein
VQRTGTLFVRWIVFPQELDSVSAGYDRHRVDDAGVPAPEKSYAAMYKS